MVSKVSIPYERERAFQVIGFNDLGDMSLKVSIPYERERAFQVYNQHGKLIGYAFQFPTNGKGLFKKSIDRAMTVWMIAMFQFPTNGKGLFKRKRLGNRADVYYVSIPYERERAFQVYAKRVLKKANREVSIPYERERAFQVEGKMELLIKDTMFQFPTNGKGHFKC